MRESRIIDKGYYSCPQCNDPQLREVIFRANGSHDMEICSCGYPEKEGYLSVEKVSA